MSIQQRVHAPNVDRDLIYRTVHQQQGRCRLRAYFPQRLVVVTELAGNPGMSVTNAIEHVAAKAEIALDSRITTTLHPDESVLAVRHALTLVEHYSLQSYGDRDRLDGAMLPTFDIVQFAGLNRHGFHGASWRRLQRGDDLFGWLFEAGL